MSLIHSLRKAVSKAVRYVVSVTLSRRFLYPLNRQLLYVALYGLGVHNQLSGDPTPNERNFLRRLAKRLRGAPVIVDVGANVGRYTEYLRKVMPDAVIYAFEPNPVAYARLSELVPLLKFEAINLACSDAVAVMALYDFEGQEGSASSSLNKDVIGIANRPVRSHEIRSVRLEDFLRDHGVEHVNFLKIDAEGHDLKVLYGAREYIRSGKIDVIQFEFARINSVTHILMKDFYDVLPGYAFFRLAVNGDLLPLGGYEPTQWELFGHQNLIAIRAGSGVFGE